ncbi:MAG: cob(I)yrinic acid a,c-diamide adenosyltransferase [Candidatus Paceibacterota bacterium]|nr:MAG: cob(I)yrinic acid a,c-diamide adenosyltransferase [Candidatus Paceibacterota bacterium]
MILLITGNGKGKTTSSLGQALRAVGDGRKVLMVQFIKGPWRSGEDDAFQRLAPDFKIIKTGKGFVGILGDTLPREEHIEAARAGLALARTEMESGAWNLLILDEVHNALALGLLELAEVEALVDSLPEGMDLMLTGRDAPQSLIDRADIVSEVKEIKHPYQEGKKGVKGVEW